MNNEQKTAILNAVSTLIDTIAATATPATTAAPAQQAQTQTQPVVPEVQVPQQGLAGMVVTPNQQQVPGGQQPQTPPAMPPVSQVGQTPNPLGTTTAPAPAQNPQDTAPFVLTPQAVAEKLAGVFVDNLVNRNYIPKLADTTNLSGDIVLKITELVAANHEAFVDMSAGMPQDSSQLRLQAQITNDFFQTQNGVLTDIVKNHHGHLIGQRV